MIKSKLHIRLLTLLLVTFLASANLAFSQISGIVKDAKTDKPLEGVEVFLDQHTGISLTNVEGRFELTEAVSGFVTMSLYKSGYELYHSSMRIQPGKAYKLNLTLTPEKRRESGLVRQTFSDDIQTGYRIVTYEDQSVRKKKLTRFELLSDMNVQQQIEWEKKRKEVYEGSLRHWLTALVRGTSIAEGFEMYVEGEQVEPEKLITKTSLPDYFRLQLTKPLEVKYREYSNRLTASGTLDVSERGVLLNDDLLKIEGPMSVQRLPLNYVPFAGDIEAAYEETIRRYYEKVYVHTDKPYYYQGEPMWFKAYLNYYDLSMRDSLSRVLYVELISPEKEIVLEKMLKIDSGMAQGDFILPDTLRRGDYFLRAYTNLQRNFGESNLYVKHIPILGITDKVDPTQAEWKPKSEGRVKISTDKEKYETREKITVTVGLMDSDGKPVVGNFSVSVTDASQVVPMRISSIEDNYAVDKEEIDIPQLMRYTAEQGITMKGVYFNENGKPTQTLLNLVQWKSNNVALVETEEDGRFEVTGFDFYDSTRIFYSTRLKDVERGRILLEERAHPFVANYDKDTGSLDILITDSPQRIISEYEVPKDARVLEEVEIVGQRFNNERIDRPYGAGRYGTLIEKKDINVAMGDLNFSLVGKVPGLVVQQVGGGWNVKITRLGFGGGEPLVTVNDVPIFGRSAGEAISTINPATVESIEVKKSINVLYGSQGAYGVIAIYTQPLGHSLKPLESATSVSLLGCSTPRRYVTPNYSRDSENTNQVDYRSGIYWGSLSGHEQRLTFYAADLETTYKVVVEGVTSDNEPIYAEKFITISND